MNNKQSSLDKGGAFQIETICLLTAFVDTMQGATHASDGESSATASSRVA